MKILVTGGTGFLGGHLVRALLERGHEVRALVRRGSDVGGLTGAELLYGDLTEPNSLRQAVEGVETVYHLAAIRDKWGTPYQAYYAVNVKGTQNLLDAAAGRVDKFVYCSTAGVARYPGNLQADESLPYNTNGHGQCDYHHTKALAEQLTLEYARQGQVPATVVRPTIVYGPGDTWGMVTRLVTMLARGRFAPVGDGRNRMHLVYVDDAVKAFLLAGESSRSVGQVYIAAGPSPITLNNLVAKVCALLGVRPPRWHIPVRVAKAAGWMLEGAYVIKSKLGISALGETPFVTRDKVDTLAVNRGFSSAKPQRELGYLPTVGYDEGLRHTVDWCRRKGYLP
ncbi:MAG TPA: NAD-dependent epimerase/dehydratase family protein [Anaerolineae bacterium]|nr:NAD-dependent epimerase/dehydratase family protein [Anaerolineae bacterium]